MDLHPWPWESGEFYLVVILLTWAYITQLRDERRQRRAANRHHVDR
jgi:hypothetical protein